ncbi:hypothetical protein RSal33209_0476 [Renibacterium salmoninarum ATCC 33209]|uniref:Uncharacterized protein n=1 Tax=Renibacterium salmoninarum (strain ATCC 33209 / DSM 20767 / JCM 11484 / NBRC 15589 / NCIMB 2235) TaxID=288705 RepID=A9WM94_RENSM|nr:hypothetical protein RSal33209_0476 [Renibacterium salmoninarum ATCC 33209]
MCGSEPRVKADGGFRRGGIVHQINLSQAVSAPLTRWNFEHGVPDRMTTM